MSNPIENFYLGWAALGLKYEKSFCASDISMSCPNLGTWQSFAHVPAGFRAGQTQLQSVWSAAPHYTAECGKSKSGNQYNASEHGACQSLRK